MRENLYKAKTKDGVWVIGYPVKTIDVKFTKTYLLYKGMTTDDLFLSPKTSLVEVIEETLCQYTGRKDKNGLYIFENDVVNVITNPNPMFSSCKGRHLVITYDEYCRFVAVGSLSYTLSENYEWEVIGNIYDKEWENLAR